MPLDLHGFYGAENQWSGLYNAAATLEKRTLQQNQLDAQKQSKRAAAGTFLQNYLDPKDLLTGTDYDPVLLQGLEALKQQGAKLAASGADSPTLMMALGPGVNKLTTYSTNAKNINKKVDEQLKGMKESGMEGYNFAALKQEAVKNALYKTGADGKAQLDPDNFDPSVDYVAKAIKDNPLAVTTEDVFDDYAKKAEKFKTLSDVTTYTPTGKTFRSKAHLISPAYMVPETVTDPNTKEEVTTGFVPKHDIATEQNQPLIHNFEQGGKKVRAPVRLLDEELYDKGLKPAMQDRIRGMVQQHLSEYEDATGKQISIDSPEAKRVGRAIGYDMLNVASRKGGSIENIENQGKPSQAEATLNVQATDKYIQNVEDKAAAAKRGRNSEPSPTEQARLNKRNVGQALGDVFTGKEDLSTNDKPTINGTVYLPGGKAKPVSNYKVVDITSSMPGGGLKAGSGAGHKFGKVYFRPEDKSLVVEEVTGPEGSKQTKFLEFPEANIGQFINRVAEANKIPKTSVRGLLDEIGYKNGSFKKTSSNPANEEKDKEADFQKRKSWRNTLKSPFGAPTVK